MRNRLVAVLSFAALFLMPAFSAVQARDDADSAAREAWVLGYMKLQEATDAEGKNNLVESLRLYREARDVFEDVKKKYPNWQSDLVDFRLKFCTSKINRLNAKVSTDVDDRSKEDLVALNRQLRMQLDAESERVAVLEQRLARMKGQASNVEALGKQVEELVEMQQKNRMLQSENTMLREDNDLLRKGQLEQIREVKVLLEAFENRLARLGAAREALIAETTRLIEERNQAVARAERLQNAMKEVGGAAE